MAIWNQGRPSSTPASPMESPVTFTAPVPKLKTVVVTALIGFATALAAWTAAGLAGPGMAQVHEASITVRFDSAPALPVPATPAVAPARQGAGAVRVAGREITPAMSSVRSPFSTSISDDGRSITFLVRDTDEKAATGFALHAAKRFISLTDATPLNSTPGRVSIVGEREVAGSTGGPIAIALLLLFGTAAVIVTTRSRLGRRALPALLHILLG